MAKQAQEGKEKKKGRRGGTLLWALLGLVVLIAGMGAAFFYMNRSTSLSGDRLRVIQNFTTTIGQGIEHGLAKGTEQGKGLLDSLNLGKGKDAAPARRRPRERDTAKRSYTVQAGESLWSIAEKGELVDSPYEWRKIMVQNRAQIDYAFISELGYEWKVMYAEGQEFTVSNELQPPPKLAPGEKRYVVQLAALTQPQQERAEYLVRRLLGDGYFAYLYPGNVDGQDWYRLRSGPYETQDQAMVVGEEIQTRYAKQNFFPGKLWLVAIEDAEMGGDDLLLGAMRVRPWVVALGSRETHGAALKDLHTVSGVGSFAYIHQRRDASSGRFAYAVRIGFYAAAAEAQAVIEAQQGAAWDGAQPVELRALEEALPGQPNRLGAMAAD